MEKANKLAYELHDMLINSIEYNNLKQAESIMLNDIVASSLINKYHQMLDKYSMDKSESVLKELHEAKLKMDLNELVIEYKKRYKDYQILVGNITEIVFKDFSNQSTIDKIIRAK